MISGIVLKGISSFYYVDTAAGLIECKARGRFRLDKTAPLAGDKVKITIAEDGRGLITDMLERKNEFIRPAVANLDQMVIIASQAPPETDLFLIDRITAIAACKGCDCVICVNKCDIDRGDRLFEIYSNAGYTVIRTSPKTGEGIAELGKTVEGKISAFIGNSGVGKSSILNALEPGFKIKTGNLSERLGRGKHTTRHVELYKLASGAIVADTPGFSAFGTEQVDLVLKHNLQYAFREFAPYLGKCRFADCSHTKDLGCAVLEAVNEGRIGKSRHDSYVKLYEYCREIKEWETK